MTNVHIELCPGNVADDGNCFCFVISPLANAGTFELEAASTAQLGNTTDWPTPCRTCTGKPEPASHPASKSSDRGGAGSQRLSSTKETSAWQRKDAANGNQRGCYLARFFPALRDHIPGGEMPARSFAPDQNGRT